MASGGTAAWVARKCEGCTQDWTVEWVRNPVDDGEDIITWRLCREHADAGARVLGSLGFQPFLESAVQEAT